MAKTKVRDYQLAALAPFLSSLTHLNLYECTKITLSLDHFRAPCEASLKALTHLTLSGTSVDDEGMRNLARLTALTHLELENTAVTGRGVRSLAPLTAHLTHLALSGEDCVDAKLIAVCSLTALTRLEMLYHRTGGFSRVGMRALASLTGLIHLELANLGCGEAFTEISSLTAISHLHLRSSCYSDEAMRALACFTSHPS
jgi:hypothetical protein